jgi:hypothetical protein
VVSPDDEYSHPLVDNFVGDTDGIEIYPFVFETEREVR